MSSKQHLHVLAAAVAALLAAASARAEMAPQWSARVPAGSTLGAGLQAMAVGPGGVSYMAGNAGSSSNNDIVTVAHAKDGRRLWSRTFDGPAGWHDQARGVALYRPTIVPPGELARSILYVCGNTPGPGSYANVLLIAYDASTGQHLRTIQYSSAPQTSEHAASVAVDAHGSVYLGGGTVGDGADAMAMKLDAAGNLVWRRVWDGPAWAPYSQDTALQVKLDRQGNLLVLIHGVMASNQPDYVVVKYAGATGDVLWEATWGVNGGDYARELDVDTAGNVYVTGQALDAGIDKIGTVKLDGATGQLLWQAYDAAAYDNAASGIALDRNGGVYIAGSSDPDGDHSNFNDNYFTIKRDAATGILRWTHNYGTNCVGCYDVTSDVLADTNGNALVVGRSSSAPYSADMLMFVLDAATGLEQERAVVSGGPTELAEPRLLRLDAQQDVFVGGQFYDANTGAVDMFVLKYPAAP